MKKFNYNSTTIALTAILWGTLAYMLYWLYYAPLKDIAIVYFIVVLLGINQSALLHRSWTHKAWTPILPINIIGLIVHTISLFGPTYGWINVHRKHHRFSDTPEDPHSPFYMSRYEIFFLPYFNKLETRYVVDLLKDKYHVFFFERYWLINVCWLSLMFALGVLSMWLAVVGMYLLHLHLIGAWLHNSPLSKAKGPGNSIINNMFAWNGEAWHKNHHDDPYNWNFSKKWWQLDVSAIIIKLLVLLKLGKINR